MSTYAVKRYTHTVSVTLFSYRAKCSQHPDEVRWRWRVSTHNGRIIGASSEDYHNEADCRDNLELLTGIVVPPEMYGLGKQYFKFKLADRGGPRHERCKERLGGSAKG